jgi:hypothetical protein
MNFCQGNYDVGALLARTRSKTTQRLGIFSESQRWQLWQIF